MTYLIISNKMRFLKSNGDLSKNTYLKIYALQHKFNQIIDYLIFLNIYRL